MEVDDKNAEPEQQPGPCSVLNLNAQVSTIVVLVTLPKVPIIFSLAMLLTVIF